MQKFQEGKFSAAFEFKTLLYSKVSKILFEIGFHFITEVQAEQLQNLPMKIT